MRRNRSNNEDQRGGKTFDLRNLMPRGGRRSSSASDGPSAANAPLRQHLGPMSSPARSAGGGSGTLYPDPNNLPMSIRDIPASIRDMQDDADKRTEFFIDRELPPRIMPRDTANAPEPTPTAPQQQQQQQRQRRNNFQASSSSSSSSSSPSATGNQFQPKQSLEPPGEKEEASSHFHFLSEPHQHPRRRESSPPIKPKSKDQAVSPKTEQYQQQQYAPPQSTAVHGTVNNYHEPSQWYSASDDSYDHYKSKSDATKEMSHSNQKKASGGLFGKNSKNTKLDDDDEDDDGDKDDNAPSSQPHAYSAVALGNVHTNRASAGGYSPQVPSVMARGSANHTTGGLYGKKSKTSVSLQDDDPRANAAWDAVHARSNIASKKNKVILESPSPSSIPLEMDDSNPTAHRKSNENDDEEDTVDEAQDMVPPITFQPSTMKRQASQKKPPPSPQHAPSHRIPTEQTNVATAIQQSSYIPPEPLPGATAVQQAPKLDQIPSVSSTSSSETANSESVLSVSSLKTIVHPVNQGGVTISKRSRPTENRNLAPPNHLKDKHEHKQSNETEEEKQIRLAKEESLKQAQENSKSITVAEDLLEIAQENASTLLSICRQGGQEGHVDPSILGYYLNMCTQDQERISSSSVGNLDIEKVEQVLAVNDMLLTAIETANTYRETWQKKKAAETKNDSLAIASLVAKKDIFSLICMLRSQQEDQRLEATLALMNFARRAENDYCSEEDRRLRNEILSSGGLHSLLTLFRSKSSLYELKVVVALAIAHILPSFVMSSSTLLKPALGLKIMECLRFLSMARDVSPRGERIAKEESFQAAAIGLATFWVNQLEPMLRLQGGGLSTTGLSDHMGRRPSMGVRRGRSTPGHVFDQRKEAIGAQELLEMTVSLIISFASETTSGMSGVKVDPVLLVEQICAVEVARPIAVREGVLKILVDWIDRGDNGRNRLAAAYSLRYLTSIKDKYMAGWIHSQMVNEGALPAIVRLTRDESLGPQVRLAIAQILASLCVAPHTRAAVVEAECIHFLVDILFEHVTSQEVASYAAQALLQLAAGAITRASALGGDGVQSFATPDKRDKVVE